MRRGEVWLINLDPTIGAEINKTRLTVIVNDDAIGILPLKVIVPITEWKDRYAVAPWMIRLEPNAQNGLDKPSAADAFQVRSVAQERFIQRLGKLPNTAMQEIARALAVVLSIELYGHKSLGAASTPE
ncbi:MAG: Endoribonuclease MazF9 [Chloroflexi bacterium]|nr:Endoribonuclease MazF9 [Chloroflexota bacterium]